MSASSSLQRTQVPHFPKAMGSFTTANTAAPTVHQRDGITSITRSNTGEYTIKLDETAALYNVAIRSVLFTTLAQGVYLKSQNEGARTVVLQIAGAGGNTAADTTGMRISFEVELRR